MKMQFYLSVEQFHSFLSSGCNLINLFSTLLTGTCFEALIAKYMHFVITFSLKQ